MVDSDRFRVDQFSRASVEILENDLWVWVGNETFSTELFRHVEYIVDLNDAKVRVEALKSRQVRQDVTAPSDITFSWAKLEFTCCGSITFIVDGNVVDTVVWSAAELPDIVSDFDCEAVVQVTSHHEYFFSKLIPFFDEHFAFIKESCPGFFLVGCVGFESSGATVGDHEGNGGDDEEKVSIAILHGFEQPFALGLAQHGNSFFAAVAYIVHVPITTRID